MATTQIENYDKAEQGRRVRVVNHSKFGGTTWKAPKVGFIKLNWDAALDERRQRMGFGFIARDHEGNVITAMSGSIPNISCPSVAEALGAWKSVGMCLSLDFSKIILEGDALEVVNALKKEGLYWCSYGIVVNDTKVLLSTFREWEVSHTKRVGNVAAHELAKLGLDRDEDHV